MMTLVYPNEILSRKVQMQNIKSLPENPIYSPKKNIWPVYLSEKADVLFYSLPIYVRNTMFCVLYNVYTVLLLP